MRSRFAVLAVLLAACGGEADTKEIAKADTLRAGNLSAAADAGNAGHDSGRGDVADANQKRREGGSEADAHGAGAHGGAAVHPSRRGSGAIRNDSGPRTDVPPNELGRFPVVEYHLIGDKEGRWTRTPENFRKDLELLYSRGYRPVSLRDLAARTIDLPAGTSPVVFTFDDASPGQFSYIEENGELRIDPNSAVGIWLDFAAEHDGWENKAVFCMLSGAEAGRAFFGNKGIEGQKTEWRHRKVKFLAEQGFELCNHTLWHATLSKYEDEAFVQEQIARLQLAVDSAVPGYRMRSMALPLGEWPKNRELARTGAWTDPATGITTTYEHDIVLLVAGGPARSPHDPEFDGMHVRRVQVFGDELVKTLDRLDRDGNRYVSDGDPDVIARPAN
ncbi:MAG TPA: polysaccharide deacetylase family protein [Longimicrobiales bacterium]|nr:polysaccharide deacetylase family protein [Longimicrobiales bacterium]